MTAASESQEATTHMQLSGDSQTDRPRWAALVWLLVAAVGLAFFLMGLGMLALTATALVASAHYDNDCMGAEIGALAVGAGGLLFTAVGGGATFCGLALGLWPRRS